MAASTPHRTEVVVFGASWAARGTPLHDQSIALGSALGRAGFDVVTGGYLGTMEGVSEGAVSSGAGACGVLVPTLFRSRDTRGNEFLTSTVNTPSLLTRIDTMLGRSSVFIALRGTLGTLTEICAAWNSACLAPLGGQPTPLIVAFRDPWEAALLDVAKRLDVPQEHVDLLRFVDSVEEAVAAVVAYVGHA